MTEQQVDRKDLKIQALLEKISNLTASYENQAADYRVEITLLSQTVEDLRTELSSYTQPKELELNVLEEEDEVTEDNSEN